MTTTLLGDTRQLNNNAVTSRTVKDAIVDKILSSSSSRPSVDVAYPDVPLFLQVSSSGDVRLYLSLLGKASSHRLRSYRSPKVHAAALRPTTAALLLEGAGAALCAGAVRRGDVEGMVLVDPMMGSGTLLLEGVIMCCGVSPFWAGLRGGWRPVFARLGLAQWWAVEEELRGRAERAEEWLEEGRLRIVGNDRERANVEMAEEAFEAVGRLRPKITFTHLDIDRHKMVEVREGEAVIGVVNPPYPEGRIGSQDPEIEMTWGKLGEWCKREVKGGEVWVLCPPSEVSGELRMRRKRGIRFRQGGGRYGWSQYLINS